MREKERKIHSELGGSKQRYKLTVRGSTGFSGPRAGLCNRRGVKRVSPSVTVDDYHNSRQGSYRQIRHYPFSNWRWNQSEISSELIIKKKKTKQGAAT